MWGEASCHRRSQHAFARLLADSRTGRLAGCDEYLEAANTLEEIIYAGVGEDPRQILTGADLLFYNSLPDTFTIYRGACGIPVDVAVEGLCWTTRRDVADWFAGRLATSEAPAIVVSTRIRKCEVWFAAAREWEVVVRPGRGKSIKVRKQGKRPEGFVDDEAEASHEVVQDALEALDAIWPMSTPAAWATGASMPAESEAAS